MGKPKKRTSARKTGLRRSHLALKLKRMVNKTSPVRVRTTKNESGKRKDSAASGKEKVVSSKAGTKAPATAKKTTVKKPAK